MHNPCGYYRGSCRASLLVIDQHPPLFCSAVRRSVSCPQIRLLVTEVAPVAGYRALSRLCELHDLRHLVTRYGAAFVLPPELHSTDNWFVAMEIRGPISGVACYEMSLLLPGLLGFTHLSRSVPIRILALGAQLWRFLAAADPLMTASLTRPLHDHHVFFAHGPLI